FGLPAQRLDPPLKKLSAYAAMLDALPLPQCLAAGARQLLAQLPARGYEGLAERIQEFLNEFDGRVLDMDAGRNSVLNAMNMDARRP
ncbi:MAG: UDP-N-acetylmuramate dehydrogenase, partial [Bifidobacterium crudilactis]|nr:UDP-N-acetylmuramate dehydrogenase [Bifidobacterium crudilactis]